MESKELEIVELRAKLSIITAESIEKDVNIKSKFEFCCNCLLIYFSVRHREGEFESDCAAEPGGEQ